MYYRYCIRISRLPYEALFECPARVVVSIGIPTNKIESLYTEEDFELILP